MSEPSTTSKTEQPKALLISGITDAVPSPYHPGWGAICRVWGTVLPPSQGMWTLELFKILNFPDSVSVSDVVDEVKSRGRDIPGVNPNLGGPWEYRLLPDAKCGQPNTVVAVAVWVEYMTINRVQQSAGQPHTPACGLTEC